MNVGGVTDLSFMDRIRVSALIMLSQPGMEGGNALADVMTGKTPFSGRLTDSWPMHYEDIPDSMHFSHNDGNVIREYYKEDIYVGYRYFDSFGVKPRYPFGYGLSLTAFEEKVKQVRAENGELKAEVTVRNTGSRNGRQVVQLYASCPAGLRKKEMKRLIGFAKTAELAPGAKETLTVTVPLPVMVCWHPTIQDRRPGIWTGERIPCSSVRTASGCRPSQRCSCRKRYSCTRRGISCPFRRSG